MWGRGNVRMMKIIFPLILLHITRLDPYAGAARGARPEEGSIRRPQGRHQRGKKAASSTAGDPACQAITKLVHKMIFINIYVLIM